MKRLIILTLISNLALSMLVTACQPAPSKAAIIKVAVLPTLDSLPIYVADAQGFFSEVGVQIEFFPVASAPERDQLMQSGQVDAMINELVSVLFYNQQSTEVVVVRFGREATREFPVFRILSAADSGILSPADLAGVPIGISEGTVIEYTTDRILSHAGLAPEEIAKIAVPKIPDRLNLLASGQLQAANLPDPAASLAILQGANLVVDDTSYPEISHSVISFSADYIETQPQAVQSFLVGVERAVIDINADKSRWNDLLTEKNLVPAPLIGLYTLPDYPMASVPSEAQFNDALAWAMDRDLIDTAVSYRDSVNPAFLP